MSTRRKLTGLNSIVLAMATCFLFVMPVHAIVGVGVHWGFDFTLNMDDNLEDPLKFSNLVPIELLDTLGGSIDLSEFQNKLPAGIDLDSLRNLVKENVGILEARAPFTLSRVDWTRSPINFGGKAFIDAIPLPFIDAIEASCNLAAWEYDAVLKYPNGELQDNLTAQDVMDFVETGDYEKLLKMNEQHLTLEEFGMGYLKMFGLSKTPYFKFQLDLSLRKNIIEKPSTLKTFRLYAGAGASLHLGTPIITPAFVEEVIDYAVENSINDIGQTFNKETVTKKIVEKLIDEAKNPTWGMHFLVGTMIKPPVIPIAIYGDAKLMIPFGDIDKNVDLGGVGFMLNCGLALTL